MDGRIGPIFEKRMQESTNCGIGPNFKRGCRIPRTTDSVQNFKWECRDPWTADFVRTLKGGCKDPRTAKSVQIFKGECGKYQIGLKRGQKSYRAVKWILKTDFLWELNRPQNIQPGGLKPSKKVTTR